MPPCHHLALAVSVALAATGCADDGAASGPLDPDTAPRVAVDRFSDAAGTLLRRSLDPRLPGPDQPIDLDGAPFLVRGLGPGGEAIAYYDLDVRPRALVPVYRLIRAGETAAVADQLNIFDYVPGDHGYNDFWRVIDVEVPVDYVANTATNSAYLAARAFPLTPTTIIVNCPMVPVGSVATRRLGVAGPALRRGWYHDQVVTYFTFEEAPLAALPDGTPTSPLYVTYAVDPGQPGGGPPSGFRTEPGGAITHNVAADLPGEPGYSALRALRVYGNAAFDAVHDRASAEAAPRLATDATLVNAPIVEAP